MRWDSRLAMDDRRTVDGGGRGPVKGPPGLWWAWHVVFRPSLEAKLKLRQACVEDIDSSAPGVQKPSDLVVRLAGVEPATLGLEVRCSVQLSYRRTCTYETLGLDSTALGRLRPHPVRSYIGPPSRPPAYYHRGRGDRGP